MITVLLNHNFLFLVAGYQHAGGSVGVPSGGMHSVGKSPGNHAAFKG